MSLTQNDITTMLSAARSSTAPYQRLYFVCETLGYATILAAWALCIVCHL